MKAPEGLIPLLDEVAAALQAKLTVMRELRRCMREADLPGLSQILEQQAGRSADSGALEQRIQDMRRRLSLPSLMSPGGVTLSQLVQMLDGPDAIAVNDRRERISLTVSELQAESVETARLARIVADLNGQMLAAIVGCASDRGTYSASGLVEAGFHGTTFEQTV